MICYKCSIQIKCGIEANENIWEEDDIGNNIKCWTHFHIEADLEWNGQYFIKNEDHTNQVPH